MGGGGWKRERRGGNKRIGKRRKERGAGGKRRGEKEGGEKGREGRNPQTTACDVIRTNK